MNIGKVLREVGLPQPEQADNDRAGGARLMYDLLANTKRRGTIEGDIWLISAQCPELLNAIPVLMRDPKNIDDVLKTDKSATRIESDVYDSVRYGLYSMLPARTHKPRGEQAREILEQYRDDPTTRAIRMREFELKHRRILTRRPRWRR
jgi:hypothetical protein